MATLDLKVQDQNTVTETEFSSSKSMWKITRDTMDGKLGKIVLPEFFDIPLVDLRELLEEKTGKDGNPVAVKARAYIGLSEFDTQNNNYEMRLYLVGVDKKGDPITEIESPSNIGETQGTKKESAIYDMITPCPPTCPK